MAANVRTEKAAKMRGKKKDKQVGDSQSTREVTDNCNDQQKAGRRQRGYEEEERVGKGRCS